MKISTNIKMCMVSMLCAAAMAGCGGGGSSTTTTDPAVNGGTTDPSSGSSSTSDTTPTPAEFNVAEYVGTWKVDAPVCNSGFPYGDYWYGMSEIAFSETEVITTHQVYNDAACASKAGRVIETFTASWGAGTVEGKTNVAKAKLEFLGSSSGADGGTGFSMNRFPDGALIGSSKLLFDVDAGKLYGAPSSPVDTDGYPTSLNAASFATKQP